MKILHITALIVGALFFYSSNINAAEFTLDINGTNVTVRGEFINAVPVDEADWEFAPSFSGAQTVRISLNYDTAQPDTDPTPNTGTYQNGTLTVEIPELSLIANGSTTQISAFNDTTSDNDQFFAVVEGRGTFSSAVGLPTNPVLWSFLLFGDTAMLDSEALPNSQLNWSTGDLNFNFTASDGSVRQVLMNFEPVVANEEPACEPRTFPTLLITILSLLILLLLILLIRCYRR